MWMILLALVLLPAARYVVAQTEAAATATKGGRRFTGTVLDKATHQPIAGATIILHREIATQPEHWDEPAKPQEIVTGEDGKFEFFVSAEELANKRFCIATEARHPHYASLMWEGEGLSRTLDNLSKGIEPWFAKLEMAPGEPVSGTLLDPQGKPLAGCTVRFVSITGDELTAGLKRGSDLTMGSVNTDANGRFIFVAIKEADLTSFSAEPTDYAVLTHRVGAKRNDLGAFTVAPGARISGTVRDADDKPVAGARVEAQSDTRSISLNYATERRATTDAAGHFEFAPVAADKYQVTVNDERFLPVKIEVGREQAPTPIEFRPRLLNLIRVHYRNSSGQPSQKRNRISASAFAGDVWFHTPMKGEGAEAELQVPKGMEDTQLSPMGYDGCTMVWRIADKGDWRRGDAMFLGTLQEPVTDVTVLEYKSPKLIVRATDPDGKAIAKFMPEISYLDAALRIPQGQGWFHDVKGDVAFEPSASGDLWTSSHMLIPDREFYLWVKAEGFAPTSQRMKLHEGEERAVTLQLKPAAK
jgi:uncharacterized GH25 family protein